MFGRLLLLMTVVPVVEFYLLYKIGGMLGTMETILLVIITGLIGASMAKREGLSVLRQIQEDAINGIAPTQSLTEGLLVLVGGVLLITPGVITDVFGLMAIFPLTRKLMAPAMSRSVSTRVQGMDGVQFGAPAPGPAAKNIRDQFDHPTS